ncbi:phytochelatin synthase family protein [Calothrix sp. 336/3]|uniref:phytochelatin synthase family protein n=1 Tax=Calothrix sp. 336/3 TaxID=1337936 RepID=UPI0004E2CE0A|nr:phytochelatin synthase family protein [Calothrix sp. 336/3]AKG24506.1 glutathione gamma-glutamylcysteinyltransferase [Calothrix sp. 336/3]
MNSLLKISLQSLILATPIFIPTLSLAQTLKLPANLISFNSTVGEKLLIDSKSREDFFPLTMHFVTQDNLAYCGVASIVMVLNALEITAPEANQYKSYRMLTQDNFFSNTKTKEVITKEVVSRQGMTLSQLGGLLATYPVKVEVYHTQNSSLEKFRTLATANLKQKNNFILVNYLRKTIGQETGGHISPIAAYNEKTDRFLILDVSRYKYPPIWVKTTELWQAMNTTDSTSGKTRGFVVVGK